MKAQDAEAEADAANAPCVLQLLNVLRTIVDGVLCLYALPLWLYILLTRFVVCNHDFPAKAIQRSPATYMLCLWAARFLLVAAFLAVWCGEVVLLTYVSIYLQVGWSVGALVGAVVGQVVLVVYGFISLRRSTNKRWPSVQASLADYAVGCGSALVDLATFVALVPALAASIALRLVSACVLDYHKPGPFHLLPPPNLNVNGLSELWRTVWSEVGQTALDVLLLPSAALVTATFYRLGHCRRTVASDIRPGDRRLFLLEQSAKVFLDLVPFILGAVCFVSHRCPSLVRRLNGAASVDEWRMIFLTEAGELALDLPFVVCFLLTACVGPWRLFTVKHNWDRPEWNSAWKRRQLLFSALVAALADWPTFAAGLCVLATVYRLPRMMRKLSALPPDRRFDHGLEHRAVWTEWLGVLIDLPCALVAVPVVVTVWRTKEFLSDFKAGSISQRRTLCWWHFGHLLLDVPFVALFFVGLATLYRAPGTITDMLNAPRVNDRRALVAWQFVGFLADLPFIAIGVCVMPMIWRSPFFIRDIVATSKAQDRRTAALQNLIMAVLDVPCALLTVVLFCTVYRWPNLRANLAQSPGPWQTYQPNPNPDPNPNPAPPCCSNWERLSAHVSVLAEALEVLLDLPCAVAGLVASLLTVYRVPGLVRGLRAANSACERRCLCWTELGQAALDLPCIALGLAVCAIGFCLTLGARPYWMLSELCQLSAASDRRLCVLMHCLKLMLDVLVIVCAIPISYRWFAVAQRLRAGAGAGSFAAYAVIFEAFWNVLLDLPFAPFFLLCICSWRAPLLFRSHAMSDCDRRLFVVKQSGCLAMDVLTLAAVLLLTVTVIRSVSVWRSVAEACRGHGWFFCGARDLQVYGAVWFHMANLLIDLPFIPMLLACTPFVWRSAVLYTQLFDGRNGSFSADRDWRRRQVVLNHFCRLALDLLAMPAALLSLTLLWRAPPLIRKLTALIAPVSPSAPAPAPAPDASSQQATSSTRPVSSVPSTESTGVASTGRVRGYGSTTDMTDRVPSVGGSPSNSSPESSDVGRPHSRSEAPHSTPPKEPADLASDNKHTQPISTPDAVDSKPVGATVSSRVDHSADHKLTTDSSHVNHSADHKPTGAAEEDADNKRVDVKDYEGNRVGQRSRWERYQEVLSKGVDVYGVAFGELLMTVLEFPCAVVFLLLLPSWRCAGAIRIWYKPINPAVEMEPNSERCGGLVRLFGWLLADIPALVLGLALCLTTRGPAMFRELATLPAFDGNFHRLVLRQAMEAIWDLPFVVLALLTLPFVHRIPNLWAILTSPVRDEQRRVAVAKQAYLAYCFDTLSLLCLVILICLPWRLPSLLTACRTTNHAQQPNQQSDQQRARRKRGERGDNAGHIDEKHAPPSPSSPNYGTFDLEAARPPGPTAAPTPSQSSWLRDSAGVDEWQAAILEETCRLMADIPFVMFVLIVIGVPLVGGSYIWSNWLSKASTADLAAESWHWAVYGALTVTLFFPWRAFLLAIDLWGLCSSSRTGAMKMCTWKHFAAFWLDHLTMAVRLCVGVTCWREVGLRRRLAETRGFARPYREEETVWQFLDGHFIVLSMAPELLLDLLCAPPAALLLATVWRAQHYTREMQATVAAADRRWVTLYHAAQLFLDLPFIAMSLLVCCGVYRAPNLWTRLKAEPEMSRRRAVAAEEFGQMLVDLPFIALGAAVVAALPQRWGALLSDLTSTSTAAERRIAAVEQLCLGLLDPLALAAWLVMLVCGLYRTWFVSDDLAATPGFFAPFSQRTHAFRRFESHAVVFRNFAGLLLDLPCWFAALVVWLSLWRERALSHDLSHHSHTMCEARKTCLWHLFHLVLDVPFILIALLVSAAGFYRLPSVWAIIQQHEHDPNARRWPIVHQLLMLLVDVPCIALGAACMWRVPFLLRDLCLCTTAVERRWAALENFALVILDPLALLAVAIMCTLGFYRFRGERGLYQELKSPQVPSPFASVAVWQPPNNGNRFLCHGLLILELLQFVLDVPFMALGLLVLCTGWRARSLLVRLFPDVEFTENFQRLFNWCRSESSETIIARREAIRRGEFAAAKQAGRSSASVATAASVATVAILADAKEPSAPSVPSVPSGIGHVPTAVKQHVLWPLLSDRELHGFARVSTEWRQLCAGEAKRRPPVVRMPLFRTPAVSPSSMRAICISEFFQWCLDLPFVALSVVVVGTLYRAPVWVRDMWSGGKVASDRRSATLQQFCHIVVDLFALPAGLVCLLFVYRFPPIWDDRGEWFRPYNADWGVHFRYYGPIFGHFFGLLVDLPCNALGLFAALSVYRGYFLYRDIAALPPGSVSQGGHRSICLYHFSMLLPDAVCAALLIAGVWWRLPTFVALSRAASANFHLDVLRCVGLMMYDVVTLVPAAVIVLLIQRVCPTINKARRLHTMLRTPAQLPHARPEALPCALHAAAAGSVNEQKSVSNPPAQAALVPESSALKAVSVRASHEEARAGEEGLTAEQKARLAELFAQCEQAFADQDNARGRDAPGSLSFYRPLIFLEAWLSIRKVHNLVLYPVRQLSRILFVPLHLYVLWRLGIPTLQPAEIAAASVAKSEEHPIRQNAEDKKDKDENGAKQVSNLADLERRLGESVTLSFLFRAVVWLQMRQPSYSEFRRLERFMLVNLMSLPLVILNELGVALMAAHGLVAKLLSFGAVSAVQAASQGSCKYGWIQAAKVLQGLLLPALVFLEVNLWFAPIYIASASTSAVIAGDAPVAALWQPLPAWWLWIVWAVFLIAVAVCLQLTWRFCLTHAPNFRPWQFWTQLMPVHAYRAALAFVTRHTHSLARGGHGRCATFAGETILLLFTLAWMFWPTVPVLLCRAWPWLALTGTFNVVCLFWAVVIVRENWTARLTVHGASQVA